jgi:hypothetical protein
MESDAPGNDGRFGIFIPSRYLILCEFMPDVAFPIGAKTGDLSGQSLEQRYEKACCEAGKSGPRGGGEYFSDLSPS